MEQFYNHPGLFYQSTRFHPQYMSASMKPYHDMTFRHAKWTQLGVNTAGSDYMEPLSTVRSTYMLNVLPDNPMLIALNQSLPDVSNTP